MIKGSCERFESWVCSVIAELTTRCASNFSHESWDCLNFTILHWSSLSIFHKIDAYEPYQLPSEVSTRIVSQKHSIHIVRLSGCLQPHTFEQCWQCDEFHPIYGSSFSRGTSLRRRAIFTDSSYVRSFCLSLHRINMAKHWSLHLLGGHPACWTGLLSAIHIAKYKPFQTFMYSSLALWTGR